MRLGAVWISLYGSRPGAALFGRSGWVTGLNVEFKILDIWPATPILIARTGFEPGAAGTFLMKEWRVKLSSRALALPTILICRRTCPHPGIFALLRCHPRRAFCSNCATTQ